MASAINLTQHHDDILPAQGKKMHNNKTRKALRCIEMLKLTGINGFFEYLKSDTSMAYSTLVIINCVLRDSTRTIL